MTEELKLETEGGGDPAAYDPAAEMQTALELVGEVNGSSAPVAELEKSGQNICDKLGVEFNPSIHKVDRNGKPLLGSKSQFLLKKEAKKTASQKLRDGINHLFGKSQEEEKSKIPEGIPLSDHEIESELAESREQISERESDLTASAESSAELYFFGGSMLLGLDFCNQRDAYFDRVCGHFRRYEERTGRKVDLPPGVALALGLGQIGYSIAQREPACKKRLDAGVEVIRKNAAEYLGDKIPIVGRLTRAKDEDQEETP